MPNMYSRTGYSIPSTYYGGVAVALVDGFPRSKDNFEVWFQAFSDDQVQTKIPFTVVQFYDIPVSPFHVMEALLMP